MGTTHADYFYGNIPCVPQPTKEQVLSDYEMETGTQICNYFNEYKISPNSMKACVVESHGAFIWGKSIESSLESSYVLELISEMAFNTLLINPKSRLKKYILDKHYLRKHGEDKYYGQ